MRVPVSRLTVLIPTVLLGLVSRTAAFEEVLIIPWGSGREKVANRLELSGRYGPTDFAIDAQEFHDTESRRFVVLDREQQMLQFFDLSTGSFLSATPVPVLSECFALCGSTVALWDGAGFYIGGLGDELRHSPYGTYPFKTVQRLLWQQDQLVAIDETGREFLVAEGEWPLSPSSVRELARRHTSCLKTGPDSFALMEPNGIQVDVTYGAPIGSVRSVGMAGDYHVVVADRVLSTSPITGREQLLIVDGTGHIRNEIALPFVYFTWAPRRFFVHADSLYVIVLSSKGLHLLTAGEARLLADTIVFPYFSDEPYHYNDDLPKSPPPHVHKERDEDPISRTAIMEIARGYVELSWTATDDNITDGIEQMPDGSWVRTPSWVTVGPKQKVPYKWGGWTSLVTFSEGVPLGKKCGDDYTESVSWTDLYCTGVDCSGLVSRCWDTDIKYGTWTIQEISTILPSFSDLLHGDALNNPGSHTRLCADDNPQGFVLTIEACAFDWRVSYRAYTLTDLSSYSPIRFNQVVEEAPVGSYVVRVKEGQTDLSVRSGPSSSEFEITTISNGQRYVCTNHHQGWYFLHLPSGTGTLGGWSFGGTASTNGFLEGSQQTPTVRVATATLNVRTGPGLGYPVITTISDGQRFAVLDSSDYWYEIQVANVPGYVSGWSSSGASGQYLIVDAGGPHDGYGATVVALDYPASMLERDLALCTMNVRNIGQCSWDSSTLLRTTEPRDRCSLFAGPGWADSTTICSLGAPVLPYQEHTVVFQIQAPLVASETMFQEHFGIAQQGFAWFGDNNQLGPPDEGILLSILVDDTGLPVAPIIDPSSVVVMGSSLTFSWYAVAGATYYGVFRGLIGSSSEPSLVTTALGPTFSSSYGVGDSGVNVYYRVRAYAPADSSEFSTAVGEFDHDTQ